MSSIEEPRYITKTVSAYLRLGNFFSVEKQMHDVFMQQFVGKPLQDAVDFTKKNMYVRTVSGTDKNVPIINKAINDPMREKYINVMSVFMVSKNPKLDKAKAAAMARQMENSEFVDIMIRAFDTGMPTISFAFESFRELYKVEMNRALLDIVPYAIRVIARQRIEDLEIPKEKAHIIEESIYLFAKHDYCNKYNQGFFKQYRVDLTKMREKVQENYEKAVSAREAELSNQVGHGVTLQLGMTNIADVFDEAYNIVLGDPKYIELGGNQYATMRETLLNMAREADSDTRELYYFQLMKRVESVIAKKSTVDKGMKELVRCFIMDLTIKISELMEMRVPGMRTDTGRLSTDAMHLQECLNEAYEKTVSTADLNVKFSQDPDMAKAVGNLDNLHKNVMFNNRAFYEIYKRKLLQLEFNLNPNNNGFLWYYVVGNDKVPVRGGVSKEIITDERKRKMEELGIQITFALPSIAFVSYVELNPFKHLAAIEQANELAMRHIKVQGIPIEFCGKCPGMTDEKGKRVPTLIEIAQVQLRSADEPMTVFYNCIVCGKTTKR